MSSLATQIDKLKDDHADAALERAQTVQDDNAVKEAVFILGRIKQNDHIGNAIAANLSAQTILALQRFQQEKKHEALGYDTFDKFLNESPYSPMTKPQYYDRLAIVTKHGPDVADLLTSIGISMRSQKMLGKGELSIQGDRVFVGDKELEGSDTGIIKEVLTELFDERRTLQAESQKKDEKIVKLESQIDQGTDEYEELRRNYDKLRTGDPYDEALAHAIYSLLDLQEQIGHLPDDQKPAKGDIAVPQLWSVIQSVKQSYGIRFNFTEPSQISNFKSQIPASGAATDDDDFQSKLDAAIAEPDDLDQEEN
jgi:cell division protein FtsB